MCMLLLGKLQEYSFEITHEEVAHKRYLTLYNRRIHFPAHADKPVRSTHAACSDMPCPRLRLCSRVMTISLAAPDGTAEQPASPRPQTVPGRHEMSLY